MPKQDDLTTVNELKSLVGSFVNDRDWQSFHTPRNLASSISIEAAELLEIFQWDLEPVKIDRTREAAIEEELSDVLIYCLSLSNVLNIDITSSIKNKMVKNEVRYPVDKFKGVYHKPEREK